MEILCLLFTFSMNEQTSEKVNKDFAFLSIQMIFVSTFLNSKDMQILNCLLSTLPNFIYSEKATKFCKISTLLLSYVVPVKSKVDISQNFVAFSEYMSFIRQTRLFLTFESLSLQLTTVKSLQEKQSRTACGVRRAARRNLRRAAVCAASHMSSRPRPQHTCARPPLVRCRVTVRKRLRGEVVRKLVKQGFSRTSPPLCHLLSTTLEPVAERPPYLLLRAPLL